MTIANGAFIQNETGDAGALYNNHGVVTISDTTFRGNFGSGAAGVYNAGVWWISHGRYSRTAMD